MGKIRFRRKLIKTIENSKKSMLKLIMIVQYVTPKWINLYKHYNNVLIVKNIFIMTV